MHRKNWHSDDPIQAGVPLCYFCDHLLPKIKRDQRLYGPVPPLWGKGESTKDGIVPSASHHQYWLMMPSLAIDRGHDPNRDPHPGHLPCCDSCLEEHKRVAVCEVTSRDNRYDWRAWFSYQVAPWDPDHRIHTRHRLADDYMTLSRLLTLLANSLRLSSLPYSWGTGVFRGDFYCELVQHALVGPDDPEKIQRSMVELAHAACQGSDRHANERVNFRRVHRKLKELSDERYTILVRTTSSFWQEQALTNVLCPIIDHYIDLLGQVANALDVCAVTQLRSTSR